MAAKCEYFSGPGSVQTLIRRTSPFWYCTESAVEIADGASHDARQKGALLAVQAYDSNGLRDKAPSIFVGDFMLHNMQQAAATNDKVKPIICTLPLDTACRLCTQKIGSVPFHVEVE
jgi:hypothetical protein